MDKNGDNTCVWEQTYVFRHLQNSKHKEDVLLAILELLVFKSPVGLAISKSELVWQVFEVGSDIGFGLCLPPEPKASASLVYLLQQLQWWVIGRQLYHVGTRSSTHENTSTQTKSVCLDFFLIAELKNADCNRQNITVKINDLFHLGLFFFYYKRLWLD